LFVSVEECNTVNETSISVRFTKFASPSYNAIQIAILDEICTGLKDFFMKKTAVDDRETIGNRTHYL
jgi:hypothetical protein